MDIGAKRKDDSRVWGPTPGSDGFQSGISENMNNSHHSERSKALQRRNLERSLSVPYYREYYPQTASWASPKSLLEIQDLSLMPNLLNQNLRFHKIPR